MKGTTWILAAVMIGATACSKAPATGEAKPAPKAYVPPAERTAGKMTQPAVELGDEKGSADSLVPPAPPGVGSAADAKPAAATNSAKKVDLKSIDLAGLDKEIAANKGKIVAIDCWATWCIPCREKFPKYVALSKKAAGPKVVFLTLSFDEADKVDDAKDYLATMDGVFTNLHITDEIQAVQEKLKFEGIPQYFLYDAAGKQVFSGNKIEGLEKELSKLTQ